jgi:hypothetical protein
MEQIHKDSKSPPVASVSTSIPATKDSTKVQQDALKEVLSTLTLPQDERAVK